MSLRERIEGLLREWSEWKSPYNADSPNGALLAEGFMTGRSGCSQELAAALVAEGQDAEVKLFDLVAETRDKLRPFLVMETFKTGTIPATYLAVDIILQEALERAAALVAEGQGDAPALREGDEVWVRGEVSVLEDDDNWIEVVFDSATGHQFLSMKPKDVQVAAPSLHKEGAAPLVELPFDEWLLGLRERILSEVHKYRQLEGWVKHSDVKKAIDRAIAATSPAGPDAQLMGEKYEDYLKRVGRAAK